MEFFTSLMFQAECCLRLLLAASCGLVIGYERKNRLKEAGIRTHMIVAIGAALMMVISKYGFFDLAVINNSMFRVDNARLAAQVISGIGFLGAGMIFVRNRSITGLTTAAGIWTTAGIGMAIGAGLYLLGFVCTGLVLGTEYWLHGRNLGNIPDSCYLTLRVYEDKGTVEDVVRVIQELGSQVLELSVAHKKNGLMRLDVCIRVPSGVQRYEIVEKLEHTPFIAEIGE